MQKRVQSQQVQTSESDDQWEWQRVWKGAFEKIRSDLDDKTKQNQVLELEVKVQPLYNDWCTSITRQ